jgi:hypothetical protein
MKTVTKLAIVGAALAAGVMFGTPAAYTFGDAPWCAVTEIGEGAQAWDCQYDNAQECAPAVIAGNRGSCTPNPYYSPPPATASVPGKGPINTTSGAVEGRKSQKDAK